MKNSEKLKISKIDRNILRILQKDGRISYTDLARKVGLSVTPCIERVKRLEKNGYSESYSATLNPELLDAGLVVFFTFLKDMELPPHAHKAQWGTVIEGELILTIEQQVSLQPLDPLKLGTVE